MEQRVKKANNKLTFMNVYYLTFQASRISILHSMANIELWAIDLSWDILARFVPHYTLHGQPLPREFIDDFVQVAVDETKHFRLLCERLKELGSYFGALSVHNGECRLV